VKWGFCNNEPFGNHLLALPNLEIIVLSLTAFFQAVTVKRVKIAL